MYMYTCSGQNKVNGRTQMALFPDRSKPYSCDYVSITSVKCVKLVDFVPT
jgi:hypothetical protein